MSTDDVLRTVRYGLEMETNNAWETNDGFLIAEKDLELRGAGQVLGTQQTGSTNFRIADLNRDSDLLEIARDSEKIIFRAYPESIQPLIERWIGGKKDYAQV